MVDSPHTLTTRHKASLQKFIEKNDWIQTKIELLESSDLPAIDTDEALLDEDVLSRLIHEHDRIEAEVQELDNGELRALRLLAKAASSHRNLSPEDTDLIEITLKVLFSVDKLLHLLRIRGKALHLLQLKNKWIASVAKVEADLRTILDDVLPTFARKARWSEPHDPAKAERRKSRLSDASDCPNTSREASPSSLRATMTSSSMARQMRAEILSLALASLTSRIHTLTNSTLAASVKVLDNMVDASPTPLPDSFLDLQDDLEARVKQSLNGVAEFCHTLARQWKQVDEVYWTCRELRQSSEELSRDIQQATLKLPSQSLADTFRQRMDALLPKFDPIESLNVNDLPAPVLPAHLPDQVAHNSQAVGALQQTIQDTSTPIDAARQAVGAYQNAAQALEAAQAYQAQVNDNLRTIRHYLAGVSCVPFELPIVMDSKFDLDTASRQIVELADLVARIEHDLLEKAQAVTVNLLKTGIDPNVRRSLQDSVVALQTECSKASALTNAESKKIALLQNLRVLLGTLDDDSKHISRLTDSLQSSIAGVLDATNEGYCTSANDLQAKLDRIVSQVAEHTASTKACIDSLDTLNGQLPDKVSAMQRLLRNRSTAVEQGVSDTKDLLDVLRRALLQSQQVKAAQARATGLDADLRELQDNLLSAGLDGNVLERLLRHWQALKLAITSFDKSLTSDLTFLAGPSTQDGFDLQSYDQAIRQTLNNVSAGLASSGNQIAEEFEAFRTAIDAKEGLQADLADIQTLMALAESVTINDNVDKEGQLLRLKEMQKKLHSPLSGTATTLLQNSGSGGEIARQRLRDLHDLQASVRDERESADQAVQLIIERLEAEVSAEKAREADVRRHEEEQRLAQERAAAEAALKAWTAELSTLNASLDNAFSELTAALRKLRDTVSNSPASDGRYLAVHQERLDNHRSRLEDFPTDLSAIVASGSTMAVSAYPDLQSLQSDRTAAVQTKMASVSDTMQEFRALIAERQAEDEAARRELLCKITSLLDGLERDVRDQYHDIEAIMLKSNQPVQMECESNVVVPSFREDFNEAMASLARHLDSLSSSEARDTDSHTEKSQVLDIQRRWNQLEEAVRHMQEKSARQLGRPVQPSTVSKIQELALPAKTGLEGTPADGRYTQDCEDNKTQDLTCEEQLTENRVKEDVFGPDLAISGESLSKNVVDLHTNLDSDASSPRDSREEHRDHEAKPTKELGGLPPSLPAADEGSVPQDTSFFGRQRLRRDHTADTRPESEEDVFTKAETAASEAISRIMDLVDEIEDNQQSTAGLSDDMVRAKQALKLVQDAATSLPSSDAAQSRVNDLQSLWHEVQDHLAFLLTKGGSGVVSARSTPVSRTTSTSRSSTASPSSDPGDAVSQEKVRKDGGDTTRATSTMSMSRLPVASVRARKQSATSLSSSYVSPLPSKLPRPMSASSRDFRSPTVASASRKVLPGKSYNALSPLGAPRLPTQSFTRSHHTHNEREETTPLSPARRHRSSNRRSSTRFSIDAAAKPNSYRPKPNHKLDVAVGRIVNSMSIPVSVTPAEVHRDEVGKYWIGDPPKLYYARILRSRTVMLRVGGGWQELGSFLSTHFDQIFAAADMQVPTATSNSSNGTSTPRLSGRFDSTSENHWLSASSLKASQARSPSRRQSFKSPRSASVHISPVSTSQSGGSEIPFDLTALLMKSTSRSPPAPQHKPSKRNASTPIPWRI